MIRRLVWRIGRRLLAWGDGDGHAEPIETGSDRHSGNVWLRVLGTRIELTPEQAEDLAGNLYEHADRLEAIRFAPVGFSDN